jgi:hypothetical protein
MAVRRIAISYSISVGVLMIAMWLFFIFTGNVPEFKTIPYSISLHLFDEFATAIMLIAGGAGLIKKARWATHVHLISMGMLFYTIIVSPGYYLDQGQIYISVFFGVLLVFSIILSILTFIKRHDLTGKAQ